jgi:hypothetical protein
VAIDLLVMAEFINRYLREYYRVFHSADIRYKDYKDFRKSSEYSTAATNVSDELYHMLSDSIRINVDFVALDIDAIAKQFGLLSSDFNDVVFWKLCRDQRFILVSDDADCLFGDIPVISANNRIRGNKRP